jgi:hypothetical protein
MFDDVTALADPGKRKWMRDTRAMELGNLVGEVRRPPSIIIILAGLLLVGGGVVVAGQSKPGLAMLAALGVLVIWAGAFAVRTQRCGQ